MLATPLRAGTYGRGRPVVPPVVPVLLACFRAGSEKTRPESTGWQSKDQPMKAKQFPQFSFTTTLPMVKETDPTAGCRTPEEAHRLLADTAHLAQEAFTVLTLNRKYRVLDRHLISLGIADASLVHPREVFRAAISDGACAIVLSHNHPSGDTTPSAEDLRITRQLVEAGKILDIEVLDHVIIGRGERPYLSLRESGLVSFSG
jgi:DNA repair protein RadC